MIVDVELAVLEPVTFKIARETLARAVAPRLNFMYATSSAVVAALRSIFDVVAVNPSWLIVGDALETYASSVAIRSVRVCTLWPDGMVSSTTLVVGCAKLICLFAGTVMY